MNKSLFGSLNLLLKELFDKDILEYFVLAELGVKIKHLNMASFRYRALLTESHNYYRLLTTSFPRFFPGRGKGPGNEAAGPLEAAFRLGARARCPRTILNGH